MANSKYTEDEFRELASVAGLEWLGVDSQNTGNSLWKCDRDHVCSATYGSIKRRPRCPTCNRNDRKTRSDYAEVEKTTGFSLVGDIPRMAREKTLWSCPSGHLISISFTKLASGCRCAICSQKAKRTLGDYNAIAELRGFKFIGDVPKNVKIPTLWLCQANHEFSASYTNVQSGKGCKHCKASKGEVSVALCLDFWGIDYEKEKMFNECRYKRKLRFDFYIPKLNTLIEYQGEFHYIDAWKGRGDGLLERQIERDEIKREFAKRNNMPLIEIPYTVDSIPEYLTTELLKIPNHGLPI